MLLMNGRMNGKNAVILNVEIWDVRLSECRDISKLSHDIGYGFNRIELTALAYLHKAGMHRKKIEDLLIDCNFHDVCGKFMNNEYDEYIYCKV